MRMSQTHEGQKHAKVVVDSLYVKRLYTTFFYCEYGNSYSPTHGGSLIFR